LSSSCAPTDRTARHRATKSRLDFMRAKQAVLMVSGSAGGEMVMLLEVGELCVPLSSVLRVRGGRVVADGRLKGCSFRARGAEAAVFIEKDNTTVRLSWNVTCFRKLLFYKIYGSIHWTS